MDIGLISMLDPNKIESMMHFWNGQTLCHSKNKWKENGNDTANY